jgi:flavonoid 3',5'-hydroxylase
MSHLDQFFLLKELTISILIFLITHLSLRSLLRNRHRNLSLPPGPTGFPVVGALPLMGHMPHVTLSKLAEKYGPIMHLKMGTNDIVVASTPSAARAFLKTLDQNFSNRPLNAGATHLAYNSQDMVFADYGSKWKLLRKLSHLHLLGAKALDNSARVREQEIGHMLHAMLECRAKGEAVVVTEMLTYAMANMIGNNYALNSFFFYISIGLSIKSMKSLIRLFQIINVFSNHVSRIKYRDVIINIFFNFNF